MAKITISNSCTVAGLTRAEKVQVMAALTLKNPAYTEAARHGRYTGNLDRYLRYYSEAEAGLRIPRGFTGGVFDICGPTHLLDHRRTLEPIELPFTGVLRAYQVEAVEDVGRFDFGVVEAATGSGKTVITLALIAERRQPALILVHTKELLYQWRDRVKQFLGVDAGLVGDGKYIIRPVSVGIVNSVRTHLQELKKRFGFIIVDECHRCPSRMFTDVVSAFDGRYMLGLSATPYRRDGLGKVINIFLGRTVHRTSKPHLTEIGAILKPKIVQVETDFHFNYADNYSKMLTALVEDKPRNVQVVAEAMRHSHSGTVLIVSDRVSHCQALAAIFTERGQTAAVLTGKTQKKERLQIGADVWAGKVRFLIATVNLIGEGFDCAALTVLVLATPISFRGRITQVAGRILRPSKDKQPIIIDFVDRGILKVMSLKRLKILNSL